MDPLARVGSIVVAAWTSGLACVAIAFWQARTIERRRSPGVEALLDRVRAAGEGFAEVELRELGSEAERSLALAQLLPRSLTRVALTSGTALAVLVLAAGGGPVVLHVTGALVAFSGGAVGMAGSALLGQRARAAASVAKAEWRSHLNEVRRRISKQLVPTQGLPTRAV
ncbi:MAG TPA: hypothetical protein VGK73_15800 [Polyangiaceae bacterium]